MSARISMAAESARCGCHRKATPLARHINAIMITKFQPRSGMNSHTRRESRALPYGVPLNVDQSGTHRRRRSDPRRCRLRHRAGRRSHPAAAQVPRRQDAARERQEDVTRPGWTIVHAYTPPEQRQDPHREDDPHRCQDERCDRESLKPPDHVVRRDVDCRMDEPRDHEHPRHHHENQIRLAGDHGERHEHVEQHRHFELVADRRWRPAAPGRPVRLAAARCRSPSPRRHARRERAQAPPRTSSAKVSATWTKTGSRTAPGHSSLTDARTSG